MKSVIVLDLDDTLFAWKDYVLSGFKVIDNIVNEKWGSSDFYKKAKEIFLKGTRQKIINTALDALKITYTNEDIQNLLKTYRGHQPSIKLFDDAQDILPVISSKASLAIITDGCLETQENKVKALDLEKWIPLIIYTDQLGPNASKPNPIAFQKVMDYYGGPPGNYTYVGDNPLKDFAPAKMLGWKTIRIKRKGGEHESTRVFDPRFDADQTVDSLYILDDKG